MSASKADVKFSLVLALGRLGMVPRRTRRVHAQLSSVDCSQQQQAKTLAWSVLWFNAVVIIALVAEQTNEKSRVLLACAVGGMAALAIAAGFTRATSTTALPEASQQKTICEEGEAPSGSETRADCEDTDEGHAIGALYRPKTTWEAAE